MSGGIRPKGSKSYAATRSPEAAEAYRLDHPEPPTKKKRCSECGLSRYMKYVVDSLPDTSVLDHYWLCLNCGHESRHPCPECNSEMGFVRRFALTPEASILGPQSDDYVYFNYTHLVCPNPECGHEEKVKP